MRPVPPNVGGFPISGFWPSGLVRVRFRFRQRKMAIPAMAPDVRSPAPSPIPATAGVESLEPGIVG